MALRSRRLHLLLDKNRKFFQFSYLHPLLFQSSESLWPTYTNEFEDISVEFHHIPFALRIYRNGVAQSSDFVPFETMFDDNDTEGRSKIFGMNLRTAGRRGSVDSPTFKLLPGEVKLFSPLQDPRLTYHDNFEGGRENWDIYVSDGVTTSLDSTLDWKGDGTGFSCDWLAENFRLNTGPDTGRWASGLGLSVNDQIHAEFAPYSSESSDGKFFVTITGRPAGSNTTSVVNAIEIDYGSSENMRELMLGDEDGFIRFPEEGTVEGREMIDWGGKPISAMDNVIPIAALSLQAKTTHAERSW